MVPFGINLTYYATSKYGYIVEPLVGPTCTLETPFSARTFSIRKSCLVYITRGSLILADVIVLTLTWIKTFGFWRQARRANVGTSLTTCLLRDGTIYFLVLLAINIAQLLTANSSGDVVPLTPFVATLPSVLINRFIINLRTADSEASGSSYGGDEQRGLSTLQFQRGPTTRNFLGNIGESLQDGWSDGFQGNGSAEGDDADPRESYTES
ncbi:uncharacterized protein PHACADRAFT_206531 [Phanerochaete carnosa HHB-10118-sp]|uniref:Uncharacterized protein n=1 Tax=Phanerochaete carnosa (strain HHB-10118-sp) TaxID=650164 RepID=K5X485_PHACS|nr:uncharacterized protein PHACADRAFT_206531 [Phanerochaete carnosa HHB-10118-sp]EKM57647.1 hypothetical protein PHACADRAFT_206531 [Phanerochaete carnosa HHB-10118-sp]